MLIRKVSDSDLPSEAPEPRTGILTVANERSGRGGEADRSVSVLKRSGVGFQFLLFRLKSLDKYHSKKILYKINGIRNEYFNC
jgi:hypothetical protein